MDLLTIGWNITINQVGSSMSNIFLQRITVQENVPCTKNKSFDSNILLCAIGKKYLNSILFQSVLTDLLFF